MKLNSSSQQRNLKYEFQPSKTCPCNNKVKTKMDTKYTNRVPESRSFGSPGVLRVSGVSNHVLYLYLQLSDRLPWVSSTGIDKMHKSQIEKRKRNVLSASWVSRSKMRIVKICFLVREENKNSCKKKSRILLSFL